MEEELVFDMVLEPHDNVVPYCAESVLRFAHLLHHASIDMCVEVPALDVGHVASLDRHCEQHRDYLPCRVINWVSKAFVRVKRRQNSVVINDVQVHFGSV